MGCEGRHRSAMPAHISSLGSLLLICHQLRKLLLQIIVNCSLQLCIIDRLSHCSTKKSRTTTKSCGSALSCVYFSRDVKRRVCVCIPLCLLLLAFSAWGEVSPVAKAKGRCLLLKGKRRLLLKRAWERGERSDGPVIG